MSKIIRLEQYSDNLNKFFVDVLGLDQRTSQYVKGVLLPTQKEIRNAQVKSAGSKILGWVEGQVLGVGSYRAYAPTIRIVLQQCPIELGVFANLRKEMKGRFVFKIPYDKDHYVYTYIDSKGNPQEMKLNSRFWGFKVYGLGRGFFGQGEKEVKFEKSPGHAPAHAGYESSRTDSEIIEGFSRVLNMDLLSWEGVEVHYEKTQNSVVCLIDFEFERSPKKWKKECEEKSVSPQDLVVLFFNLCSKLAEHIKEDFPQILDTHPLFNESK